MAFEQLEHMEQVVVVVLGDQGQEEVGVAGQHCAEAGVREHGRC